MSDIYHVSKFFCNKNIDYNVDLFPKCKGVRSDSLSRVWFAFLIIFLRQFILQVKLVPNLTTHLGGIFYYIDLPN